MALFILSSIACAGAHSFAMMLAARACAGFFAGASRVIPVGIVRARFRGDALARVLSLIFAAFMLIPVMAPPFGQTILCISPGGGICRALANMAPLIMSVMGMGVRGT